MVEGIILAAGLSIRTGSFKMELKIGEKTLIELAALSMYEVCSKIFIVTGHQSHSIEMLMKKYEKVEIVRNLNYHLGMFSSVKEGIRMITGENFFILPGDYPIIRSDTFEKLLVQVSSITIPTYQNKKGHPILIDSRLIPEILREPIDSSLREYINKKKYSTIEVDDPGILMDIDTMEDYNKLLKFIN